ncbi:MAG: KH domain-containing protein [Candidatus Nanoarchaeia archaeon]|nr:KH domain-containing protein [Candidatus Nanoarchaeia archaeon]MDD5238985.1 KH domain-containing protein [Candidatus Nanoarchaeia archaeon]
MDEYSQMVKIPKERIAVLIGTKGATKRDIEEKTNTKLKVSAEGDVDIFGESYETWVTRQVIKAIGRGFSPKNALLLLEDEYAFEIIELKDFASNEHAMTRLKSRVIGTEGKSREVIEELTMCHISVYGKTVSIIGKTEYLFVAKKAIEMLLTGAQHATVFKMLETERKEMYKKEILGGE